jgi:hypothetical protein
MTLSSKRNILGFVGISFFGGYSMKSKKFLKALIVATAACTLLLGACSANVTRNTDGSLSVTSTITGDSLNAEIKSALADPLVQDVTVTLQSGYADVSATRKRLDSDKLDTLTFRLDLGASGGQLTATVSNAQVDGRAVEADRVAEWNTRIANRLANFSQRRENSTLQSVTITPEGVTMVWRVETKRSQGN